MKYTGYGGGVHLHSHAAAQTKQEISLVVAQSGEHFSSTITLNNTSINVLQKVFEAYCSS